MYTITLLVPHRYLVTGNAMTTIAYNFRIGVLTARKIILDVSTAIWDAMASIYLQVPSEIEWHSIADEFMRGEISKIVLGLLMGSTL